MLYALRALINPHCEICGELHPFIHHQLRICQGCRDDLSWICSCCQCCGMPLNVDAKRCGACLKQKPNYHHTAIPWRYEFPVAALIRAYKHQGQSSYGRLLSDLLAEFLKQHYANQHGADCRWPQALLPVPLHRNRERQRGFNQAAEIAGHLAQQLNLPLLDELIIRQRDTASQQGLNRKQRKQNLKHAFHAIQATGFRRIAIVDDVVTTGATADAVAERLQQLGVSDIHVWAFARTPSASNTASKTAATA